MKFRVDYRHGFRAVSTPWRRRFFLGIAVILAATILGLLLTESRVRRICRSSVPAGFLLVVISTTPLSVWVYVVWTIAAVLWLVPWKYRTEAGAFLIVVSISAGLMELPWHLVPRLPNEKYNELYVIGDSISVGIGQEKYPWPNLLARKHQVKVINLARGGARVKDAMIQAERIRTVRTLVLLEIGGNDLLQCTPSTEFENGLTALLATVVRSGRTVVMLELPLLPSRMAFGDIQRRLARKYQVILVPKSRFAGVLLSDNATVDGIHLSDAGHQRMAAMVWNVVGQSLVQAGGPERGK